MRRTTLVTSQEDMQSVEEIMFDFQQRPQNVVIVSPEVTANENVSLPALEQYPLSFQPAMSSSPASELEQEILDFNNTLSNYMSEQTAKSHDRYALHDSGIQSCNESYSSAYSENTLPAGFQTGFFQHNNEYAESDVSSYDTNSDYMTLGDNYNLYDHANSSDQAEAFPQTLSDASPTQGQKTKPKRKRVINKTQRKAANVRERKRMTTLNDAFDHLKSKIPVPSNERKLSRIETLKMAITYINYMSDLISGVPVGALELTGTQKKSRSRKSRK